MNKNVNSKSMLIYLYESSHFSIPRWGEMVRDVNCEIKCLSCCGWFRAPIQFEDAKSFFESGTYDSVAHCPHCGEMTPYKMDNMRFQDENKKGKIFYVEGQYAH
jgi:hypothetical protein